MNFLELAGSRQSCRAYLDRAVERDKIEYCLEAARLAPSACNAQPWTFVVVDDAPLRRTVAEKTFGPLRSLNQFVVQAPVLVVIVSERQNLQATIGSLVKRKAFNQMDVAIAAEHFCLAATESGLGTCMIGWFDEAAVKAALAIPSGKRVELILAAGYSAEEGIRPKKRQPADQFRRYNGYA
ncbi:MAG: nitroreductase family protein [Phycisphaerae bacterium]|nr:nitroreductase family protein [Phycisphaerae bacterium]